MHLSPTSKLGYLSFNLYLWVLKNFCLKDDNSQFFHFSIVKKFKAEGNHFNT